MSLPAGLHETHSVEIRRVDRSLSGGEVTHAALSVATGVSAHIQPFSGTRDDTDMGLRQRARVRFYVPGGTDLIEGDQLKVSATLGWKVEEIEDWSDFGRADHIEGLAIQTETPW